MIATVALDIDETVADLHRPWIRWYNRLFGQRRDPEKGWAYWDEPRELKAMDFLQPLIYDADIVRPFPWVSEFLEELREHRISILWNTIDGDERGRAKWRWLHHHGMWRPEDYWMMGMDKATLPAEALVDDAIHFVRRFPGTALLMDRPHNHREPWDRRVTPETVLSALLAI